MRSFVIVCALVCAASAGGAGGREKRGFLHGAHALGGYSSPAVSYTAQSIGYSAPVVSYSAPAVSYSAPSVSYSAPSVTYSAPSVSYSVPAVSYSAPATRVVSVNKVVHVPREVSVPQVVHVRKVISEPKVITVNKLVPVEGAYTAHAPLSSIVSSASSIGVGGVYSAAAASTYGAGYASGW